LEWDCGLLSQRRDMLTGIPNGIDPPRSRMRSAYRAHYDSNRLQAVVENKYIAGARGTAAIGCAAAPAMVSRPDRSEGVDLARDRALG
jgi:hypothetical protein